MRLKSPGGLLRAVGISLRTRGIAAAVACITGCALAACASGPPASGPPASGPSASVGHRTDAAGFAGYKWTVTRIGHGATAMQVPARYSVYVEFTPSGQFGADDSVNSHSGTYTVTPGGFTTSSLGTTLVGYVGHDPVVLLAVGAIGAFGDGTRALATVSGDTLTITVGSYVLTAHRDGLQPNWLATHG